ncbi:MAG TPA: hypothetical protein VGH51_10560 [Candidatus Angelobacter sp.]|jgi:hypothetical protein
MNADQRQRLAANERENARMEEGKKNLTTDKHGLEQRQEIADVALIGKHV